MDPMALIVIYVVLSPILAFLYARDAIRLWAAIALVFATAVALQGEVQVEDEGIISSRAVVAVLVGFLGLAFVLIAPRLRSDPLDSGSDQALLLLNRLLALIAGICAGLLLLLTLAIGLRGLPGGLIVHWLVVALAVVLALASTLYLKSLVRIVLVPALLIVAVLVSAGGLFYPQLIAEKAAETSENFTYCLRSIDRAASLDETRLFTLPRGRPGAPGLILTVMNPAGVKHYRWSYRHSDFIPYGAYKHGACPA